VKPFRFSAFVTYGKDVSLAGGAQAAQQHLAPELVDEMEINLVRTVAAPKVTHLKFTRR
jgi:dihydrofolate reductase